MICTWNRPCSCSEMWLAGLELTEGSLQGDTQDGTLTWLAVDACRELSQICWLEHLNVASSCLWDWQKKLPAREGYSRNWPSVSFICSTGLSSSGALLNFKVLKKEIPSFVRQGSGSWKIQSSALSLNFIYKGKITLSNRVVVSRVQSDKILPSTVSQYLTNGEYGLCHCLQILD